MALQSLPASTGAPSASMASSSSTFSTVIAHGRFPNVTPSIVHSLNAEIQRSGVSEQHLGGNYPGLAAEATHSAGLLGDLLNNNGNNGIGSVEKQPYCGSVREPNESDERDEWLGCPMTGGLDDIITAGMTANHPQMAESAQVPSNFETWQHEHIFHQLVSVPTIPGQLYPSVSPPATINVHSPLRTKVRRRWTTEMHDRFVDAVNQLGGCENAKPKAILDIMNVEGLTREQVKSHLQKYKLAHVRHRPSEVAGTSVDMTTSNEGIPSDLQIRIQEFALQVQIEFQKKLHDMVERTRQDLLEIHRSVLEKHVMSLHEFERQNLNMDHSMVHLLPSPAAVAATTPPALSAGASTGVCGEGSRTAAFVEDVQASEDGSLGNHAGA